MNVDDDLLKALDLAEAGRPIAGDEITDKAKEFLIEGVVERARNQMVRAVDAAEEAAFESLVVDGYEPDLAHAFARKLTKHAGAAIEAGTERWREKLKQQHPNTKEG